ncbi:hypothetical protein SAMN05216267_1007197 [Actinacidiphila rubida]|uniref:Uncharacterized protein n=1 Tax=Actinacidiphila rubida TaxID=310780 RepID=A0A1H8I4G6_9ACTN|nr:hypothetical protein [Actinacidiphila rubida]SEN63264.1 hypothetical protein SAMN05216267_1007197 [Actinacidiphila rubida]
MYFSVSDHVPGGVHEVVRDRAAMGALLDRFGARDADAARAIGAATRAADFSRSVVVVWADVTGCSAATSVVLQVAGDRLQLAVTRPEPPPECFAPDRMTAVFEVPRGQVPGAPEFRLVGQR